MQKTNISVWRQGRHWALDLGEGGWSQGVNEIMEKGSAEIQKTVAEKEP